MTSNRVNDSFERAIDGQPQDAQQQKLGGGAEKEQKEQFFGLYHDQDHKDEFMDVTKQFLHIGAFQKKMPHTHLNEDTLKERGGSTIIWNCTKDFFQGVIKDFQEHHTEQLQARQPQGEGLFEIPNKIDSVKFLSDKLLWFNNRAEIFDKIWDKVGKDKNEMDAPTYGKIVEEMNKELFDLPVGNAYNRTWHMYIHQFKTIHKKDTCISKDRIKSWHGIQYYSTFGGYNWGHQRINRFAGRMVWESFMRELTPKNILAEVEYLKQKNRHVRLLEEFEGQDTDMLEFRNNYRQRPCFNNEDYDELNVHGLMRKWKHDTLLKKKESPPYYWDFHADCMITEPRIWIFQSFKDVLVFERTVKDVLVIIDCKHMWFVKAEWLDVVKANKHLFVPIPEYHVDPENKTFIFGDRKIELEGDSLQWMTRPRTSIQYCMHTKQYRMEFAVISMQTGVIEEFIIECVWRDEDTVDGMTLVGHRLVIHGQSWTTHCYIKMTWDENKIHGIRYKLGKPVQIDSLKPHEYPFQNSQVFGAVRHLNMEKDNDMCVLVVDSRLTDQEKQFNPQHHMSKLLNSSRNLLNCTTQSLFGTKLDAFGNPNPVPKWTLRGLLQPCASLHGYTKLDHAFGTDALEKKLSIELLEKEKLPTLVESFLETIKDSEFYEEMMENLEKHHWILKPNQMSLNMRFSHPVIDSFYFYNSKKFAYTRKVCVEFMLHQPQFLSHHEILLSMMFLCIEPENNLREGLELFTNQSFTQITQAAVEMDHKKLPKTASSESSVEFMDGDNPSSFKSPPVTEILKNFEDYSDDQEFYMKHYFFDMRKSFDLNLHQNRYLKEYNFLGKKFNENHEDEAPQVKVYPTLSEKGFSNRFEFAKFLRDVSEQSGEKFEHHGIPIIMIEDQFEKTKWVQIIQGIMATFGFLVPFMIQCYSQTEWVVVVCNILCLITNILFSLNELIQIKTQGKEYLSDLLNYVDMGFILIYYLYFVNRMTSEARNLNIIPHKGFTGKQSIHFIIANNLIGAFGFVKVFSYMRISNKFSKFTIMITNVMGALDSFYVVFILMLVGFGFLLSVTGATIYQADDYPKGINGALASMVQLFRNAIGDITIPTVEQWDDSEYDQEIIWWVTIQFVLASFVMIVVMLNFLIAAISQIYDDVMGKEAMYVVLNKADLNVESAILLDFFASLTDKKEWFFKCFYLQVQSQSEEKSSHDGFVKTIKKTILKSCSDVRTVVEETKRTVQRENRAMNESLKKEFAAQKQQMDSRLRDEFAAQKKEMDELKELLNKIANK